MVEKTKALKEEETKQQQSAFLKRQDDADASKFLQTDGDKFSIQPIVCFGEWVAIAPLQPETISSGGIVLPKEREIPDTGIVLSANKTTDPELEIGMLVKYSGKHANTSLKGYFEHYGDAEIIVLRATNIFTILPPVNFEIVTD